MSLVKACPSRRSRLEPGDHYDVGAYGSCDDVYEPFQPSIPLHSVLLFPAPNRDPHAPVESLSSSFAPASLTISKTSSRHHPFSVSVVLSGAWAT